MPGLYGYSGNANVAVGNTIGLYQQNTGTVQVLSSAQLLLSLLSNASTVGFSLTSANTQVQGTVLPSGVSAGTYGNLAFFPTFTVGSDGRLTQSGAIELSQAIGGYGNANVAAFLPVYGGTINSGTIFNGSGLAVQGPDYAQLQWTNGAAVPASEYDVGTGSWFYLDAGGGVFQSNSTGTLKTILLGNDGNLTMPISSNITNGTSYLRFNDDTDPYYGLNLHGNADVRISSPLTIALRGGGVELEALQGGLTRISEQGTPIADFWGPYGQYGASRIKFDANLQVGGPSVQGNIVAYNNISAPLFTGIGANAASYLEFGGLYNQPPYTSTFYSNSSLNISSYNGTTFNAPEMRFNVGSDHTPLTPGLYDFQANGVGSLVKFEVGGIYSSPSKGSALFYSNVEASGSNVFIYETSGLGGYLTVEHTANVGRLITTDGVFWANGDPYSSGGGGSGTYGNANVAAYLGSNAAVTITTTGNITTTANIISPNYLYPNGVSILTGIGGTYSNANVAAYLTTATIATSGNITGANLITGGNVTANYVKGNAALMTGLTAASAGVYGSDTVIPTIQVDATGRITQITTNAISGGGSYGNANVAAYLPTFAGDIGNAGTPAGTGYFNTVNATTLSGALSGSQTGITAIAGYTEGGGIVEIQDTSQVFIHAPVMVLGDTSYTQTTGINGHLNIVGNVPIGAYAGNAIVVNNGNVQVNPGYYYLGDGSQLVNLPAQAGTYSNANVASYLPVYSGDLNSVANITTSGALAVQGTTRLGGATVSAPYLSVDIFGNQTWNAGSGLGVAPGNIHIGQTGVDLNGVSGNLWATGNITANTGGYFVGDGRYLTNLPGGGTYGNANVAAYLPVFGGNILAGNVNIPYTSGTRNRGPLAIGGNLNHYDSGVVASFQGNEATYLYTSLQNSNTGNTAYASYAVNDGSHTYYGELGINSGTYDYAAAGYPNNAFSKPYATFIQSTGANLAIGTYDNNGISFLVNGQTNTADAMTIANTGNVTVTGNLAVGSIASTNGYFWANGTAYSTDSGGGGVTSITAGTGITANAATGAVSITNTGVTAIVAGSGITANVATGVVLISATGGGGGSFSGNLLGNTLVDTTNYRVTTNASPYSDPGLTPPLWQNMKNNNPSYVGGVLQPALGLTNNAFIDNTSYLQFTTGNVGLQSSYQTATTRFTSGILNYQSVWPVTANSMTNSDRLRHTTNVIEINMNGKSWGTNLTQLASVIGGQQNFTNVYGNGTVLSAAGVGSTVYFTPIGTTAGSGLTANLTYATAVLGGIQTLSASANTLGNITNARGFLPTISIASNTHSVTNAIGLHTPNGWVTAPNAAGGLNITNRYAILNEDQYSVIQTNGNVTMTGGTNLLTTGNLRVGGYYSPNKRYANPSSGNVAVSGSNMLSFQQISLAGNIGITASINGFDTTYDFKIEQTFGGNTVQWYDGNGIGVNTQVYGFLNPIPGTATIARAIMSDGGLWTVNYANPTAPSNTAANWRLYAGVPGATVSISDAGGKIAYWDTTNTRWSYIFDNSAV